MNASGSSLVAGELASAMGLVFHNDSVLVEFSDRERLPVNRVDTESDAVILSVDLESNQWIINNLIQELDKVMSENLLKKVLIERITSIVENYKEFATS